MHNKLQDPRPDEAMLTKTEGIFAEENKVYHICCHNHFELAFEFYAPVLYTNLLTASHDLLKRKFWQF